MLISSSRSKDLVKNVNKEENTVQQMNITTLKDTTSYWC